MRELTVFVFVCLFVCYIIQLTFFLATIFLLSNTRLRESPPAMHPHVHAIYKIREFLSCSGFNLIKVYFSVHYSAVAPAVRF